MPAGVALTLFDGAKDQLLLLRAHALDPANSAGLCRFGQIVEALHVQVAVEQGDRLRPDALQAQDVEQRRREFRSRSCRTWQSPVVTMSRIREARSLPIPDQRAQRCHIQGRDGLGGVADDVGRRCGMRGS